MNVPIRRLAVVAAIMICSLMVGVTWWQFAQASRLNADERNTRSIYREHSTYRGSIVVGGNTIAYSEPVDTDYNYLRRYTDGDMYSAVTGFYSVVYGRSGLELAENDILTGQANSLFWSRLQDLITGRQPRGGSIELTIDPVVQQAAWDALGDQRGAIVATNPQTGEILAMVSKPTYDPNDLAKHNTGAVQEAWRSLNDDPLKPMSNRAIAGDTYPPGSVFKLVTAAAAIEQAGLTADSEVYAPEKLSLPGTSHQIGNYGGSRCTSNPDETMRLKEALRISCNTSFAQLGMDLGGNTLREYAEKFGFDSSLSIPMPVTPSRFPTELDEAQTAMTAMGQYDLRVTPMQVNLITAAIANDGVMMQPYLVDTVRTPDLSIESRAEPSVRSEPIRASTASVLQEMMLDVVANGSGSRAQISGVQVAGKTGTAQTGRDGEAPHAWFTAYAPADNPQVAVTVVVENGGDAGNEATGGSTSAPIARAVMEAVLSR